MDDPAAAFVHDLSSQPTMTPIAPFLLLIALLLLPFDVAVRRLLITRSDLARLRAAFSRREPEVIAESSPRFSSLMGAKARARQQTERDPVTGQPPTPPAGSRPADQPESAALRARPQEQEADGSRRKHRRKAAPAPQRARPLTPSPCSPSGEPPLSHKTGRGTKTRPILPSPRLRGRGVGGEGL